MKDLYKWLLNDGVVDTEFIVKIFIVLIVCELFAQMSRSVFYSVR